MSPVLRSIQLFLLAGMVFLLVGSIVSAVIARAIATRARSCSPQIRHRILVILALTPWCSAFGLSFSATVPSLIGLVVPGFDHCTTHDDGHAHLCFMHLPKAGTTLIVMAGLAVIFGYGAIRIGLSASRAIRATRAVRTLANTGLPLVDITLIETSQPVCFAAGLWRPRILVSRGLLESLDDNKKAIVLAHEQAHVRRRDPLIASLVRACAMVHVPGAGRWIVREVEIAAEQVCDEEAGALVGDRLAVADAILTIERAVRQASVFGLLLKKRYAPLLEGAIRHCRAVGIASFALLAIAIVRRARALSAVRGASASSPVPLLVPKEV